MRHANPPLGRIRALRLGGGACMAAAFSLPLALLETRLESASHYAILLAALLCLGGACMSRLAERRLRTAAGLPPGPPVPAWPEDVLATLVLCLQLTVWQIRLSLPYPSPYALPVSATLLAGLTVVGAVTHGALGISWLQRAQAERRWRRGLEPATAVRWREVCGGASPLHPQVLLLVVAAAFLVRFGLPLSGAQLAWAPF